MIYDVIDVSGQTWQVQADTENALAQKSHALLSARMNNVGPFRWKLLSDAIIAYKEGFGQ